MPSSDSSSNGSQSQSKHSSQSKCLEKCPGTKCCEVRIPRFKPTFRTIHVEHPHYIKICHKDVYNVKHERTCEVVEKPCPKPCKRPVVH